MTLRNEIFKYVKKKYGTEKEFLWRKFPNYAILRHNDNKKWYALIMNIPKEKLGLGGKEIVDILNLKIGDIEFKNTLVAKKGYFDGYHLSKKSWISILLDGTVKLKEIYNLIDISFMSTASKAVKDENRLPISWIVPANPKYYDVEHAFDGKKIIDWKQGKGIKVDDTVYMYVAAPISAILYKCKVTETNIPFKYADKNIRMTHLMKIKLLKKYSKDKLDFDTLKNKYDIRAIRGPIKIGDNLFGKLA